MRFIPHINMVICKSAYPGTLWPSKQITVSWCMYRTPDSNVNEFFSKLEDLLQSIVSPTIVLAGDFNTLSPSDASC